MADNGNYGQVAVNAEIMRQERAESEIANRETNAIANFAMQIETLKREVAQLRNQRGFDGKQFGKEIVAAVKGYVDPALDDIHNRIDALDAALKTILVQPVVKAGVVPKQRIKALSRPMKDLQ